MKDLYKQLLTEIDDLSESKNHKTAVFTYGFVWGRAVLARELQLITADQMTHIHEVADTALEDWETFFS